MFETKIRHPNSEEIGGELGKLFDYWEALRGDKFAPSWKQFDWECISIKVIPWVAVVDVKLDPRDFIFRFWGTARTDLAGKDYTRCSVTEFSQQQMAEKAFREYAMVFEKREPIFVTTFGTDPNDLKSISYDSLRMPFSNDGKTVQNILNVSLFDSGQLKLMFDFYGTRK